MRHVSTDNVNDNVCYVYMYVTAGMIYWNFIPKLEYFCVCAHEVQLIYLCLILIVTVTVIYSLG